MPLTEVKSPLASKTLWINGLTLAVAVLTAVSGHSVIPAEAQPYILGTVALLNVVLRFLTTQPIVTP